MKVLADHRWLNVRHESKILTGHEESDIRHESEVLIGHRELNVRHKKKSPNKSMKIGYLVIVKSRRIKIDQMLSDRSHGKLKDTKQG